MLDPHDFDFVNAVPKLEGDSNYHKWRHHLKVTFGREPLWEVLTGELQPLSPPKLYKTDRDVVRGILAEKNNIEPHQVTGCLLSRELRSLRTENETLQTDYDKRSEEWNQINSKALEVLRATICLLPESRISEVRDANKAWRVLQDAYGHRPFRHTVDNAIAICKMDYSRSEGHVIFCDKFQNMIAELHQSVDKDISWFEYATFCNAIDIPATHQFIFDITRDRNKMTMTEIYNQFIMSEDSRKAAALTTRSANPSNDHSGSNNRGTGKGRDRGGSHPGSQQPLDPEDFGTIWCCYHDSWGSHYSSLCSLNPKNEGQPSRRRKRYDPENTGTVWCYHHNDWGTHFTSACRLNPKNQD